VFGWSGLASSPVLAPALALQAGGRRFDPGWLHCGKDLLLGPKCGQLALRNAGAPEKGASRLCIISVRAGSGFKSVPLSGGGVACPAPAPSSVASAERPEPTERNVPLANTGSLGSRASPPFMLAQAFAAHGVRVAPHVRFRQRAFAVLRSIPWLFRVRKSASAVAGSFAPCPITVGTLRAPSRTRTRSEPVPMAARSLAAPAMR
jgi:hypothetical protein